MRSVSNNTSIFFEGVVESRADPLKLGRVQVRVFGYHTDDLSALPTADLHWASVVMPVTSASVSGIGSTPALVEGSHVVGYFRDGTPRQDPVILGSLLGIPMVKKQNGKGGFNDPKGVYPKYVGEPDTHRLARNQQSTDNTALSKRIANKDSFSTSTNSQVSQPDPQSLYKSVYPFNKVIETESGHTIELDDTHGAERVCITHKTGTFIEMSADGTIVCRVLGDGFNLVNGNTHQHSKGVYNLTIDQQGNVYCVGDYTFKTDGNMKFDVKGNVEWNVKGNVKETIDGNMETQSQHINVKSKTDINMTGSSNVNITGSSATTIKGGGTTEELNSNYSLNTGAYGVTASGVKFTV